MKAAPVRVLRTTWSRNVLNCSARGASSEPDVAEDNAQFAERDGIDITEDEVVEYELSVVVIE